MTDQSALFDSIRALLTQADSTESFAEALVRRRAKRCLRLISRWLPGRCTRRPPAGPTDSLARSSHCRATPF
jgi:hypothetical protein